MERQPELKTKHESVQLYEVIRIIEGIPLFLEDHLDRLYRSAQLTGMGHLPEPAAITGMIRNFTDTRKLNQGNIKLTFSYCDNINGPQCELDQIPHHYPTPEDYNSGVKVSLIYASRPLPGAKVQHHDIRDRANRAISSGNFFEVLLIDSEGNITEGSRSNVFFIKNNILFSPPGDNIADLRKDRYSGN
jgi:branched-chain amino acid aminotransferase